MKNKSSLSLKEKRILDSMSVSRSARVKCDREVLVRAMKLEGEEQRYTPSEETIQKINREIEHHLMQTLFFIIIQNKLTVEYVDKNYDRLFLIPNDKGEPKHKRTLDETPLKSKIKRK